ncbi:MAG: hypothetical protein ACOZJX_03625 [Pseudomonadota bacterium]
MEAEVGKRGEAAAGCIALAAERMRQTLVELEGVETGTALRTAMVRQARRRA